MALIIGILALLCRKGGSTSAVILALFYRNRGSVSLERWLSMSGMLAQLTSEYPLAEDVAQEAFIKLYETPPRDPARAGGWLFRVATNLAINRIRSERSRISREARAQAEASVETTSEEIVIRREEAEMVHRVLNNLEERDRTCLIMKFSGFSYDEIAQAIGVKKTSVGTIIARAQAKFREKILEIKGVEVDVL